MKRNILKLAEFNVEHSKLSPGFTALMCSFASLFRDNLRKQYHLPFWGMWGRCVILCCATSQQETFK
jgi:hypothetical protein